MTTDLLQIGEDIWTYEGSTVSFYGFPFPTRMTVIRLASGDLWIHSPIKLEGSLQHELSLIGEVRYLVSPNKLHHLFLSDWINTYPTAKTYAAPGLAKKRTDIKFDYELSEVTGAEWEDEISLTVFSGSPAMEEVVFFHGRSSTLILADLIENFNPAALSPWQVALAKFTGILSPHGKTPVDWRISFMFGSKKKARASLEQILEWSPENIVISHGECVFGNAGNFLKSSFSWLQSNA